MPYALPAAMPLTLYAIDAKYILPLLMRHYAAAFFAAIALTPPTRYSCRHCCCRGAFRFADADTPCRYAATMPLIAAADYADDADIYAAFAFHAAAAFDY